MRDKLYIVIVEQQTETEDNKSYWFKWYYTQIIETLHDSSYTRYTTLDKQSSEFMTLREAKKIVAFISATPEAIIGASSDNLNIYIEEVESKEIMVI